MTNQNQPLESELRDRGNQVSEYYSPIFHIGLPLAAIPGGRIDATAGG
jgi:hypothetical protein